MENLTPHHARPLPIQLLEAEFTRRKSLNPRYSLRAFAQTLGVPSGRLSEFLSGKRRPTAKISAQIADRLGLSPEQSQALSINQFGRDLAPEFVKNLAEILGPNCASLWQYNNHADDGSVIAQLSCHK